MWVPQWSSTHHTHKKCVGTLRGTELFHIIGKIKKKRKGWKNNNAKGWWILIFSWWIYVDRDEDKKLLIITMWLAQYILSFIHLNGSSRLLGNIGISGQMRSNLSLLKSIGSKDTNYKVRSEEYNQWCRWDLNFPKFFFF